MLKGKGGGGKEKRGGTRGENRGQKRGGERRNKGREKLGGGKDKKKI